MKIFIRSQGKKRLVEMTQIEYEQFEGKHRLICGKDYDLVGTYKTEERCVEIIDEIQKILLGVNPIDPPSVLVYEMPKE